MISAGGGHSKLIFLSDVCCDVMNNGFLKFRSVVDVFFLLSFHAPNIQLQCIYHIPANQISHSAKSIVTKVCSQFA